MVEDLIVLFYLWTHPCKALYSLITLNVECLGDTSVSEALVSRWQKSKLCTYVASFGTFPRLPWMYEYMNWTFVNNSVKWQRSVTISLEGCFDPGRCNAQCFRHLYPHYSERHGYKAPFLHWSGILHGPVCLTRAWVHNTWALCMAFICIISSNSPGYKGRCPE